jgi:hypothetical protein
MKRLARLFEKHPEEFPERIDTFYLPGETIYKDTTVIRYLPGETTTVEVPIHVPIRIPDTTIYASTSLASALAHLKNNKLGLELIQNDTLFQFLLDSAIREQTPDTVMVVKEHTVEKQVDVTKPFWKIGFLILAGLLIIGMFFRFALGK